MTITGSSPLCSGSVTTDKQHFIKTKDVSVGLMYHCIEAKWVASSQSIHFEDSSLCQVFLHRSLSYCLTEMENLWRLFLVCHMHSCDLLWLAIAHSCGCFAVAFPRLIQLVSVSMFHHYQSDHSSWIQPLFVCLISIWQPGALLLWTRSGYL